MTVVIIALLVANRVFSGVVARRIARRKGRRWVPYWFFGGWIGVLVLKLRSPVYRNLPSYRYARVGRR